ncbi:MAG: Mur ligase family protein [Candidatus Daviesbacteria bacterium]|nr:Mur ligase family protein [Candidatus Daviesbacteria bacterium]
MEIQNHPIWNNIKSYKKPAHMARFFVSRHFANLFPRSTFVGITGSVSKTSTTMSCLSVLSEKFPTIATDINLDSILNIPITILKIKPKTKKVILEMGVEYPGEMDFYLSLVKPATAIITKISYAHSEFLGNIEGIYNEKAPLVRQLPKNGFAILNYDDSYCRKLAKETEAQVIFFGMDSDKCDIWSSNIRLEDGFTRFELNYGVERVEVAFKYLGRHMVYPALAAAALGLSCDMSLLQIKKGLEKVKSVPHRLQLMEGINGFNVIDDTHNSSPAAVEESLNVLNELPAKKRIAVLGEMKELGKYSEALHRGIAQKIYKDRVDLVLLGSGDALFIIDELIKLGFPSERVEANLSNTQLVNKIIRYAGKGDIVLVKGSHAVKLSEVVQRITKQSKHK